MNLQILWSAKERNVLIKLLLSWIILIWKYIFIINFNVSHIY